MSKRQPISCRSRAHHQRRGRLRGAVLLLLATANSAAATTEEGEDPGRVDSAHQAVSASVDALARWLDAFFNDPNYASEEGDSRLELRQSMDYSDLRDTGYRVQIGGRLALPNLSRRLSLTFEGNADETVLEDGAQRKLDDATDASLDDPAIGLRYLLKTSRHYHTVLNAGIRLENPSLFIGPRFRYQHDIRDDWLGRYTQRILWDTDDGFESRTRADFDRQFDVGHLFRQSFRADWREDKKDERGIRYTLSSTFVQRLRDDRAISYGAASVYSTKPQQSWTSHTLFVRYRQNFFRDWAFIEAGPFLAFENEFGWDANPGIRIALDIIFEDDAPDD